MRALDIGPGDEVISVSMKVLATLSAIEMVGATPVLVDVDAVYHTMVPESITDAISPRTKAVIPVRLYGQPADRDLILSSRNSAGIPVVKDASQGHHASLDGRRVRSMGAIGTSSCYPTRNLGAKGDAEMVATSDGAVPERLRCLRQYGWPTPNENECHRGSVSSDHFLAVADIEKAVSSLRSSSNAGLP